MKAWKMKITFTQSKIFAMQSERFELKKESNGVTVPMMLQRMNKSMKTNARVIDIIEKSIGRSVHLTSLYTL